VLYTFFSTNKSFISETQLSSSFDRLHFTFSWWFSDMQHRQLRKGMLGRWPWRRLERDMQQQLEHGMRQQHKGRVQQREQLGLKLKIIQINRTFLSSWNLIKFTSNNWSEWVSDDAWVVCVVASWYEWLWVSGVDSLAVWWDCVQCSLKNILIN